MKLDRPLSPTLEHIERRIFGVSDALIEAVERGETSRAIAQSVRQSPEWLEHQARNSTPPIAEADTQPVEVPPMPAHLRDIIHRRQRTLAAFGANSARTPEPGQIVEVREIPKEFKQLEGVMQVPLYVLLDAPAEAKGVWHGWLVAAETDYAGWWDFVLQDEDGPADPEAGMVQIWNPVRIYLPTATRVVARLAPARLQALRALAAEYVSRDAPADIPVWPGRVAARTTLGGLQVATGSPLGGDEDPRHRYQHLYHHAAEAIRAPARLAMAASVATPATSLFQRLREAAQRFGQSLLPVPQVELAMGSTAVDQDLIWDGLVRISLQTVQADGAGRATVTAESDTPVTCTLLEDGDPIQSTTIHRGSQPWQATWGSGATFVLKLRANDGRLLELPLSA